MQHTISSEEPLCRRFFLVYSYVIRKQSIEGINRQARGTRKFDTFFLASSRVEVGLSSSFMIISPTVLVVPRTFAASSSPKHRRPNQRVSKRSDKSPLLALDIQHGRSYSGVASTCKHQKQGITYRCQTSSLSPRPQTLSFSTCQLLLVKHIRSFILILELPGVIFAAVHYGF